MAQLALIICRQSPGVREDRLRRILEFFGVPCRTVNLTTLAENGRAVRDEPYAILTSIDVLAASLATAGVAQAVRGASAVYAYGAEDTSATAEALSSVAGVQCAWLPAACDPVSVAVTAECGDVTGPMSGVRARVGLADGDGIVTAPRDAWTPLVSANEGCAFVRIVNDGLAIYAGTSAAMVDIDAPVSANYYDVRKHFLSAVPLVMFITWAFRDVMWRPQELGACLIIDDPLLKSRYGFCDFAKLRDAMHGHRFTTSIAFIPWNWRRTRQSASAFFRREADLFSVSVHGCDHVSAEFGSAAPEQIERRARLAQARMRRHESRTHIQHDPVMVFPQGVFSSVSPAALKRNGFVAAVNTEISPVDQDGATTLVRDVWDTAIMRYGSFPVYTRRYHHHGLENFAFDLLLGKPCFIVAHHEFFRDGGKALAAFVDQLNELNCTLQWRSLREVIRRACRTRSDAGAVRVQMYGTELQVVNSYDRARDFHVMRREDEPFRIAHITNGDSALAWTRTASGVEFHCTVPARSDALVGIAYETDGASKTESNPFRYEVSVAVRRILSEFRDEYLQKLPSYGARAVMPETGTPANS